MEKSISVIFSTKSETEESFIFKALKVLKQFPELEVIISDYQSTKPVKALLKKHSNIFIDSKSITRAGRLNEGLGEATCDGVLLHHPRSYLQARGIHELLSLLSNKDIAWGGFTHQFDDTHNWLSRFTSWYSNKVRCDKSGILYLDHCIFFKKSIVGSDMTVPQVDIFEDTELSLKLLMFGHPYRLIGRSTTSSVRFKKNGWLKQSLINQLLKICYYLKVSPRTMNKIYEKGLSLN